MHGDLTPYLYNLTPDPAATADALAFARSLPPSPRVVGRLEDLIMCFSSFVADEQGPRLPGARTRALEALHFAASGLYAFLEEGQRQGAPGWATLTHARLWAVRQWVGASAAHPRDVTSSLVYAMNRPHMLPGWAHAQRQGGQGPEVGHLAAWGVVSQLLEAAPTLEDGDAEDLTHAMLEALESRKTARPDLDLPWPDPVGGPTPDPVHVAQYVTRAPGDRVTVHLGGGEDYTAGRSDAALTPLPDGAAFLALTVEGQPLTVRLSPDMARQVRQVFGLEDGEEEAGQVSPLN
jgi:hypothetical protein